MRGPVIKSYETDDRDKLEAIISSAHVLGLPISIDQYSSKDITQQGILRYGETPNVSYRIQIYQPGKETL